MPSLLVLPSTSDDAQAVCDLALQELGRTLSLSRVSALLSAYPGALAWKDEQPVGFVFGSGASPDIIEMANLLVAHEVRREGIGARLVEAFEEQARKRFCAVLVSTSTLWLAHNQQKPSAVPFYRRLGYRVIYETDHTALLVKDLQRPPQR